MNEQVALAALPARPAATIHCAYDIALIDRVVNIGEAGSELAGHPHLSHHVKQPYRAPLDAARACRTAANSQGAPGTSPSHFR
jgi:hypothetical protein